MTSDTAQTFIIAVPLNALLVLAVTALKYIPNYE